MQFNLVYTHQNAVCVIIQSVKSCFNMDELKSTLFFSNNALGHSEKLYCFKKVTEKSDSLEAGNTSKMRFRISQKSNLTHLRRVDSSI